MVGTRSCSSKHGQSSALIVRLRGSKQACSLRFAGAAHKLWSTKHVTTRAGGHVQGCVLRRTCGGAVLSVRDDAAVNTDDPD